ncbi:MAG: c-type cytochrome [Actinobacteria bacterium]|nr:c-type cytochrome [Actinomycetota bacterium]
MHGRAAPKAHRRRWRFSWWLLVPLSVAALTFGYRLSSSHDAPLTVERALGPVPVPPGNPQTPQKVELGKILFFDPRLSAGNARACATCHDPAKGWSDGLARGANPRGERNTISLFNIAYEDFPAWDGFAASLEEHNGAALTFDFGDGAQAVPALVHELSAVPEYRGRFGAVFGGEISYTTIIRALAAFERSVLTFRSPYDRYQAGDRAALTEEQRAGLVLFTGKAGCSACHTAPLFADNRFHALGVPQAGPLADDPGRFAVTGDQADRGAFRTPTLRNVALTAPYMHDGALATLADVTAFYDAGGGTVPGRSGPEIGPLHLSDRERQALVAFLESLTDTTTDTRPAPVPAAVGGR